MERVTDDGPDLVNVETPCPESSESSSKNGDETDSSKASQADDVEMEIRKIRYNKSNGAFCFETEELALKGNSDYKNILQAIVMLEAQREKAVKDCQILKELKEEALSDPFSFVERLAKRENLNLPKRQKLHPVPIIEWEKYAISGNPSEFAHRQLLRLATCAAQSFSRKSNKNTLTCEVDVWSPEELKRLEELMVEFPPEVVESERWIKIADSLESRTPLQVSTQGQKIINNGMKSVTSISQTADEYSTEHSLETMVDGEISLDLKDTAEYQELALLNKILEEKLKSFHSLPYKGFKCCHCKYEQFVGSRWHCMDCKPPLSIDFCERCVKSSYEIGHHISDHRLQEIRNTSFLDKDYMHFPGNDYNYLDPNYMPAAT